VERLGDEGKEVGNGARIGRPRISGGLRGYPHSDDLGLGGVAGDSRGLNRN